MLSTRTFPSVLVSTLLTISLMVPGHAQDSRGFFPYVDGSQLSDEGPPFDVATQAVRALRLRAEAGEPVALKVWSDDESKNTPDMMDAWELIQLLQTGNEGPVSFVRSAASPVTLVAWMWNVYPSNIFGALHWRQWDPPSKAGTDITRGGMPWDGEESRPTICHWSTLIRQEGPTLDFVLIDAARRDRAIGCFAAGLLKHIGNPIWSHLANKYGGLENADAMVDVRRIFQCALRVQSDFVQSDDARQQATTDSGTFMNALKRALRQECLNGEM